MEDIDYPEYDPTPYGGGFDLEEVYGKSTAPSEKSCYAPSHADLDHSSLRDDDEDDKLSVISAYGVEIPDFGSDKKPSVPQKKPLEGAEHKDEPPKQEELTRKGEGQWEPNSPAPDSQPRGSDLAPLCYNCGMPVCYSCGCHIFRFCPLKEEEEEEEQGHCNQETPEDVANRVAEWLFSSSYI